MQEAYAAYEAAAPLVSLAGDTWSQAELTMRRGYLSWDEGHVEEPLDLFRLASSLYTAADCPAGTAHATAYEAWAMLQLGHREQAARLAREVLDVPHADPAWPPTLIARITLGVAIAHVHPDEAVQHPAPGPGTGPGVLTTADLAWLWVSRDDQRPRGCRAGSLR